MATKEKASFTKMEQLAAEDAEYRRAQNRVTGLRSRIAHGLVKDEAAAKKQLAGFEKERDRLKAARAKARGEKPAKAAAAKAKPAASAVKADPKPTRKPRRNSKAAAAKLAAPPQAAVEA